MEGDFYSVEADSLADAARKVWDKEKAHDYYGSAEVHNGLHGDAWDCLEIDLTQPEFNVE